MFYGHLNKFESFAATERITAGDNVEKWPKSMTIFGREKNNNIGNDDFKLM